jgi:hypothetical protein
MTLSVCAITGNSGPRQHEWMRRARAFADELVIGVDADSGAETLELARFYGDLVQLFEHPQTPEQAFDWIRRKATGDWILALDDDEFMNRSFAARLADLTGDRQLTHYLIPRRWVVTSADGGHSWIRAAPWYPDAQVRLFRNIGSLFSHVPEAHTGAVVLGEGRLLNDDDVCIYHMDLAWKTREQREAKVRGRYGAVSDYTAAEYYLFEDRAAGLALRPVPAGELEPRPEPPDGSWRREFDPEVVPLASMIEAARRRAGQLPIHAVQFLRHDTPAVVPADSGVLVQVELRNTSSGVWRTSGGAEGRVMLAYHWLDRDGQAVVWDGRRSFLPRHVGPGATVMVAANLMTPATPGRYTLVWEMVEEQVCWFAEKGADVVRMDVEVRAVQA